MHHALEIAELVEIICGHVAPSEELRRRKDLNAPGDRVKTFSVDDEGFFNPPEIYDSLRACIHETSILPNLRSLDWPPRGDGLLKHVQLFLSPAITHLTACMISSKNIPVLNTFTLKCPHVTHLTIGADWETPDAIAPISRLVCALQRLESLDVPGLDANALLHVARLPTLRHLCLAAGVAPLPSLMTLTESADYFAALTRLEYWAPECTPALLQMIRRPLTDLKFRSGKAATSSVVEPFISALSHHCADAALQNLWLLIHPIHADNLDSYLVGEEILKPLFSFGNLVSVRLAYPVGFDIDDAVVRNMARAWPRLEALILPHHHPHHLPPIRVTLAGVYSLAKYCPLLERPTMS
ncbi:hypothetical protein B0H16DRAFT_1826120 [Mycena metata]|uniref:F-box domain-containing protein n=1 Tax=Mycena metata TaxID=1033252 RepID=A0AAD7NEP4_9AGAR|nr:hypothetical protein B0H16DRAFT_1826120 [Mycena metata]